MNMEGTIGHSLLGINLACEAQQDLSRDVHLGAVTLRHCDVTLKELRQSHVLDQCTLPEEYAFITTGGYQLSASQEEHVYISQIITDNAIRIRRLFDKPRIGVTTQNGKAIGFIFINQDSSIAKVREEIKQQLGSVCNEEGATYQFLDRNGWPISTVQERHLALVDLLHQSTIRLCPQVFSFGPARLEGKDEVDTGGDVVPVKKRRVDYSNTRKLRSFSGSKDDERPTPPCCCRKDIKAKQILLSYVRAEASQQALTLKEELMHLGFTVYLDIHEMKTGVDWQDDLNNAVTECEVFIPLVTARYGETRWTNREVKLADVLNKLIVPINFQNHWPPKCLAIQFATTQYIRWKSDSPGSDHHSSHPTLDLQWKEPEAVCVTRKIADLIRQRESQRKPALTTTRSCPVIHSNSKEGASSEGGKLVLICLHPQQQAFGDKLKERLMKEGYRVTMSTSVLATTPVADSPKLPFTNTESMKSSKEASRPTRTKRFSGGKKNTAPSIRPNSIEFRPPVDGANLASSLISPTLPHCSGSIATAKSLRFQENADKAGVIIFILSEAFAKSRASQQQVFYCEHRKRIIPLTYEEFCMPGWMSLLIGTGVFEDARSDGFEKSLLQRVQAAFDPAIKGDHQGEINEENINKGAQKLRDQMPGGVAVYISGSTSFYNNNSEAICKAIGTSLASVKGIHVITGGFFGVGDTVGRSYHDALQKTADKRHIYHILPHRDEQDRSHVTHQKKDRCFKEVPYGRTVFVGESVREREAIVARVFDISILVEGGPGAAHEAEQFSWNDHVVIPINSTGGAASGKFNVPDRIFKRPRGVDREDWRLLADVKATAEEIGEGVARIVSGVQANLEMESQSHTDSSSPFRTPGTGDSQVMKKFVF